MTDLLQHAFAQHQQGHLADAERAYRGVLAETPDHFEALHYLGVLRLQAGDANDAHGLLTRAAGLRPGDVDLLGNLAAVKLDLGRNEESLAISERILAGRPGDAQAQFNRASALASLGRGQAALQGFNSVLAKDPDNARALYARGTILAAHNYFNEALADYDRILARLPQHVETLINRGNVLIKLERRVEALAMYERVLALQPDNILCLGNSGILLKGFLRFDESLACFDRVLALAPANTDALYNRAKTLSRIGRYRESIADFEAVIARDPNHAQALNALAIDSFAVCDWARAAALKPRLSEQVAVGRRVDPFTFVVYGATPEEQLACARNFARLELAKTRPLWSGQVWRRDKIRVAYLSSDFRVHPIAMLLAPLIERHDRARFEIIGVSYGADDGSPLRARMEKAFDSFHDVRGKSDGEVAQLLRSLEVEIAVDLNNYSDNSRPGILAHRPAPIQASYLGYPSTMGVNFIDYVIADAIVLPTAEARFYTEHVVTLPPSFMVAENGGVDLPATPTREACGLPADGFVFCCFNDNYKIRADVFGIWMGLLKACGGSVLWLLHSNDLARDALRREAEAHGVDPQRLVFAPRQERAAHLARMARADLFLDTWPVNAGVTAVDALSVGLPVLTWPAETYVGRVCASLLTALGTPDLIAATPHAYAEMAQKLATDPALLSSVRDSVAAHARGSALFDVDVFARRLESAFTTMVDRWQQGLPAQAFTVGGPGDG